MYFSSLTVPSHAALRSATLCALDQTRENDCERNACNDVSPRKPSAVANGDLSDFAALGFQAQTGSGVHQCKLTRRVEFQAGNSLAAMEDGRLS